MDGKKYKGLSITFQFSYRFESFQALVMQMLPYIRQIVHNSFIGILDTPSPFFNQKYPSAKSNTNTEIQINRFDNM